MTWLQELRFGFSIRLLNFRQKLKGQPRIVRVTSTSTRTTYTLKGKRATWRIVAKSSIT